MKLNYKILIVILCFLSLFLKAYPSTSIRGLDAYEWGKIDASKNARLHSNMGNIYFDEKNYIGALEEYKIAYNLNPESSTGATYLYNMSRCYMKMGNYKYALKTIEGAIKKDCINLTYYEALVDCYMILNITDKQIPKLVGDTQNPYNRIIIGLIYLKQGKKIEAKIIFDEFINNNPDMVISEDIRSILKRINN